MSDSRHEALPNTRQQNRSMLLDLIILLGTKELVLLQAPSELQQAQVCCYVVSAGRERKRLQCFSKPTILMT